MRICKIFSIQITLSPKKKCSCNKAKLGTVGIYGWKV